MIMVRQTIEFSKWIAGLKDRTAFARINVRLIRAAEGNLGETRSVGEGVHEMKINYGPGYRVYFINRGSEVIVLLCGGDKGSQDRDIKRAKALAKEA